MGTRWVFITAFSLKLLNMLQRIFLLILSQVSKKGKEIVFEMEEEEQRAEQ